MTERAYWTERRACGWGAGCELPAGHIGMHAKGAPKPAQEPSAEPRILAVPIDGTVEQGTGSLPSAEPDGISPKPPCRWEHHAHPCVLPSCREPSAEPGEPLVRYGLEWTGPMNPVGVLMADGYWTPWHIAERTIADLRAKLAEREAEIAEGQEQVRMLQRDISNDADSLRRVSRDALSKGDRLAAALKRVEELETLIMADECAEHCPEICCQSDIHAEARAILAARAARAQEKSK